MSFIIETATGVSAASIASLIKQWSELRDAKKEEELKTPEWQQLEKAYIDHLKWRFGYPQKVFGQQILANWIITFVVLALVVSGLVFSFIQLQYAIELGDMSSLSTEIQIETAGKISVGSSIVGAITLIISLAFFALYLKYVFQIKHTNPPHVSLSDTDAEAILKNAKAGKHAKDAEDGLQIKSVSLG
ncbi:hypothetical protein A6F57_01190 [Alteromonas stellipolaris]|uniref:hypothetical protein n=1 Tax=Alteromonas stellipolaris TaxID=233316 RepID=UPI0007B438F0|nr:hypothetical protein [Alteromonas stellipolaris]ANB23945.1 hypothetical protein A6F57_01190 [Alteromonas stellipolaris]